MVPELSMKKCQKPWLWRMCSPCAPLLVAFRKGCITDPTDESEVPESRDKKHPLLMPVSSFGAGEKLIYSSKYLAARRASAVVLR